jgi:hypothetical protein
MQKVLAGCWSARALMFLRKRAEEDVVVDKRILLFFLFYILV